MWSGQEKQHHLSSPSGRLNSLPTILGRNLRTVHKDHLPSVLQVQTVLIKIIIIMTVCCVQVRIPNLIIIMLPKNCKRTVHTIVLGQRQTLTYAGMRFSAPSKLAQFTVCSALIWRPQIMLNFQYCHLL